MLVDDVTSFLDGWRRDLSELELRQLVAFVDSNIVALAAGGLGVGTTAWWR